MFSVLIVEDERNIRLLVSLVLKQQGYEVTEAINGLAALSILSINPHFDLIITNIQMPVMSGIRLITELGRLFPTMPLLVMSGYLERLSVRDIPKGVAFLAKPFSRGQLLVAVSKIVAP